MTTLTATFQLGSALKGRVVRALKKELPKGCTLAQPQVGTVRLVCAGMDGEPEDNLRRGLDALTAAFQEEGLAPSERCPYCRKGDCDAVGGLAGAAVAGSPSAPATGYVPVHRVCVEERAAAGAAHAQKNMIAGSYGMGVLGAVLGAMVAAIPTVAFQVVTMSIPYLLSILIPLGAWFGYKKLGGGQTMAAFWSVAAVTMAFTWLIVDQAVFYILLSDGGLRNPLETIAYFYYYFEPSEVISDLVSPTIWSLVGLMVVFGQRRKGKAAAVIEDAGAAVESLMSFTPKGGVDL